MRAKATEELDKGEFVDSCLEDSTEDKPCVRWNDTASGFRMLKTGDLLFFADDRIKSQLQRMFSGKKVTHVGVVVWSVWCDSESKFLYVPTFQEGAVLGLMEVSNRANADIETDIIADGFQHGDMYAKLQHQPKSTHIFIKPLKSALDEHKLRTLSALASCLHARRPEYVKWLSASESTIGKFWDAWMKSTEEEDEKYKYMFCSQFAALVVMALEGPLTLGGATGVTPVLAKDGDKVMLPGDFDPGDVKAIDSDKFGELYQLQLPYAEYREYAGMAEAQEALLERSQARDSRSMARDCKAGLPHVEYATTHLPTWTKEMEATIHDSTCNFKCNASEVRMRVPGAHGTALSFAVGAVGDTDWRLVGTCLVQCEVAAGRGPGPRVPEERCGARGLRVVSTATAGGSPYHLCCKGLLRCPAA